MADKPDMHYARRARLVGIVLAGTMVLWLGGQWLGGRMDWPPRFALLFDLAAAAGFIWAMIVTYRISRNRPK